MMGDITLLCRGVILAAFAGNSIILSVCHIAPILNSLSDSGRN